MPDRKLIATAWWRTRAAAAVDAIVAAILPDSVGGSLKAGKPSLPWTIAR